MKRSGSPHPPRAGHHEDDNSSTNSTSSATDAVCEPPAALRIAATAGAPPGAASVYQYVDENARAIAPAEELGEPALALSLLLIGQLEKLCSLPRPESDLIRTQRELSGLAERYPFLVQNELMTQVLTWFLRPEYRSAQNAHRGDSALVWVAASVAHAGYFGAGGSSSSSDRRRRALPCEYVRAYALDMLGDRFWTGPAGAGGGLGERIGDVLGGKLAPPWLYAPDRAAWDAAVGDTLAAVLRDHRAHARTPAQHRAGLKVLARGLAFAPCRLLLAALLDGDSPSTSSTSSTSSSSILGVPALASKVRKAIGKVRRFVGTGGCAEADRRVVAALAHVHARQEYQAAATAALDEIVARAPALFADLLDSVVTAEFLQDSSASASVSGSNVTTAATTATATTTTTAVVVRGSVSVGLVAHLWKVVPGAAEVLARLMAGYVQRAGVRSASLCAAAKRFLALASDGGGASALGFARAMVAELDRSAAGPREPRAAQHAVDTAVEVLCFVLVASVPGDVGAEGTLAGSVGTRAAAARFLAAAGEYFGVALAWAVRGVPRLFALPAEHAAMARTLAAALRTLLLLDAPRCVRDPELLGERTRHHALALVGDGRAAHVPLAAATVRALVAAATQHHALSYAAALNTLIQLADSATLFAHSPFSLHLSSSSSSSSSLLVASAAATTTTESNNNKGKEDDGDNDDPGMKEAAELTTGVLHLADHEERACGQSNTELLWRACILLLVLAALAPQSIGRHLWARVPTCRALLEMVVTQQWRAPSLDAPEQQQPLAVPFVPESTLLAPPPATVETVRQLDRRYRLARALARPEFLADLVAAQPGGAALAWLAPLVQADQAVAAALPRAVVCELLAALHRTHRDTAPLAAFLRSSSSSINDTAAVVAFFAPRLASPVRHVRVEAEALMVLVFGTDTRSSSSGGGGRPWPDAVAARLAGSAAAVASLWDAVAAACAATTDLALLACYLAFLLGAARHAHRRAPDVLALVRTALLHTRPLLAAAFLDTVPGRAAVSNVLQDALRDSSTVDRACAAEVAFAVLSCTPATDTALPDVVRSVCSGALVAADASSSWHFDAALAPDTWHPDVLERLVCACSSEDELREHARVAACHVLGCARVLDIVAAPGLDAHATEVLLSVLVAQGSRCVEAVAALSESVRAALHQMLGVYQQAGVPNSEECATLFFPQKQQQQEQTTMDL